MRVPHVASRNTLVLIAGLAMVASLQSCGGSSGPTPLPTPTPIPTPTPPVVVAQGGGPLEAGFIAMAQPIVTTASGALEVTVDWTFATNDIDIAVTRGSCTFDQLENGQCNVAGFSVSDTAKPERVRITGATAGTYTLFVENTGSRDDAASYQAVLFPGASSASAAGGRSLDLPDKLRGARGRTTW